MKQHIGSALSWARLAGVHTFDHGEWCIELHTLWCEPVAVVLKAQRRPCWKAPRKILSRRMASGRAGGASGPPRSASGGSSSSAPFATSEACPCSTHDRLLEIRTESHIDNLPLRPGLQPCSGAAARIAQGNEAAQALLRGAIDRLRTELQMQLWMLHMGLHGARIAGLRQLRSSGSGC